MVGRMVWDMSNEQVHSKTYSERDKQEEVCKRACAERLAFEAKIVQMRKAGNHDAAERYYVENRDRINRKVTAARAKLNKMHKYIDIDQ